MGVLDLTGLKEADWKSHTHPVTRKETVPVPLDPKLAASQMGRKTTFVVYVQVRPGRSSLVPMPHAL